MKPPAGLCVALALWTLAGPLLADTLQTTLEVASPAEKQTAENLPPGRRSPDHPRAVVRAKLNETLTGRWTCRSADGKSVPDVLIHFFVVREDQLNQARVPALKPDRVVIESALTMDFKKQETAKANLSFKITEPGLYLIRVEVQGPDTTELTEDFAALDLEVK